MFKETEPQKACIFLTFKNIQYKYPNKTLTN